MRLLRALGLIAAVAVTAGAAQADSLCGQLLVVRASMPDPRF